MVSPKSKNHITTDGRNAIISSNFYNSTKQENQQNSSDFELSEISLGKDKLLLESTPNKITKEENYSLNLSSQTNTSQGLYNNQPNTSKSAVLLDRCVNNSINNELLSKKWIN